MKIKLTLDTITPLLISTLVALLPLCFVIYTTKRPPSEEFLRHKEVVVKIANGEKQTLPDDFNIDRYHDIIRIMKSKNLITEEQTQKASNVTVTVQTKVEPKK